MWRGAVSELGQLPGAGSSNAPANGDVYFLVNAQGQIIFLEWYATDRSMDGYPIAYMPNPDPRLAKPAFENETWPPGRYRMVGYQGNPVAPAAPTSSLPVYTFRTQADMLSQGQTFEFYAFVEELNAWYHWTPQAANAILPATDPVGVYTNGYAVCAQTAPVANGAVIGRFILVSATNVPSLANLAAIRDQDGLPAGTWGNGTRSVRVTSLDAVFDLDETSTLAATPTSVINTTSSGSGVSPGRWIRRENVVSLRWANATAWFIDPANSTGNASDENTGLSGLGPLLTFDEWIRRRTKYPTIFQAETITFLSDMPNGNKTYVVSPNFVLGGRLSVVGTRTQVASGTFTAVTPRASGTNNAGVVTAGTLGLLTDTGQTFTALVGDLIRITSGARAGSCSSIAKSASATTCRYSSFVTPGASLLTTTEQVPQVGDPYSVFRGTKISPIAWYPVGYGDVSSAQLVLTDLWLDGAYNGSDVFFAGIISPIVSCVVSECMASSAFGLILLQGAVSHYSNNFNGGAGVDVSGVAGTLSQSWGGESYVGTFLSQVGGSTWRLGSLWQNTGWVVDGGVLGISDVQAADWSSRLLIIEGGGASMFVAPFVLTGTSAVASSTTLQMTGTATRFFSADGTNKFLGLSCAGAKSGGADFFIRNNTTGPAMDPTFPATQFYSTARTFTLALLTTTFAGGGFQNDCIDPRLAGGVCAIA